MEIQDNNVLLNLKPQSVSFQNWTMKMLKKQIKASIRDIISDFILRTPKYLALYDIKSKIRTELLMVT